MKLEKFIFIVMFILINLSTPAFSQNIPYKGLTLDWSGTYSFENQEYPSFNKKETINYHFVSQNGTDGLIQQENIYEDIDNLVTIFKDLWGVGYFKGSKLTPLISTNITNNSRVKLSDYEYAVSSLSDDIYLLDFGQINAIKLINKTDIRHYKKYNDYNVNFISHIKKEHTIWYDKNTGLMLKSVETTSYQHKINTIRTKDEYKYVKKLEKSEYELKMNAVDTDKDGLSDLKELLDIKTNPTSYDTDNDGLSDKKEFYTDTDPNVADPNSEKFNNKKELDTETNPNATNSNSKEFNDIKELAVGTDPAVADLDKDVINDVRGTNVVDSKISDCHDRIETIRTEVYILYILIGIIIFLLMGIHYKILKNTHK